MSSEAAAFFPNALASAVEVRESERCAPEIPVEIPNRVQFPIPPNEKSDGAHRRVSEASDESLLEQVGEGSGEALVLLFRRHARAVRNVAHRILRDEAEADDLVQEVFLFIFRKAVLFDGGQGTARSWIFQVAYHRAFDRRRYLNSRHYYAGKELEDTASQLADPRNKIPFHELSMEGILGKQLMEQFNQRLTSDQKETIQLYFFEGHTLREIAQLTGRSLIKVRSHYYRGLKRLRQILHPATVRSK